MPLSLRYHNKGHYYPSTELHVRHDETPDNGEPSAAGVLVAGRYMCRIADTYSPCCTTTDVILTSWLVAS